MHFVLVKFFFSKKAHYRQPKNTWLAQTMDRDRSLSKLELGIPGWMVGKSSILRRTNSLLACHCLFVSQCPLKDSTQLSRCGFWPRNSETTSPLSAAITANTQKLLREVQTKRKCLTQQVQGLRAVILDMFPSDRQTNSSAAAGKILTPQTERVTHKHKCVFYIRALSAELTLVLGLFTFEFGHYY